MKINEKIYSLRKKHNLSQEELADRINVSRQTVSKWELGDSTPDFDKIVPLCEVFGISTDELLTNKKIEENNGQEDKPDTKKALYICIAIFMYFIGIVSIVLGEEYFHLNEGLLVSVFLLIVGLATALIVYTCMTRPSKKKDEEEDDIKDPTLKAIISIVTLLVTGVYLFVSFTTMAWHITWIIWIIYSLIIRIIKLAYSLKGDKNNE